MKRPSKYEKDLTGESGFSWEKYALRLEYYAKYLEETVEMADGFVGAAVSEMKYASELLDRTEREINE